MTKLEKKIDALIDENRELKQVLEILLKKIGDLESRPPVINNYYYNQEQQNPYLTPPYVITTPYINTQPNGTGDPNAGNPHFTTSVLDQIISTGPNITFTTNNSSSSDLFTPIG